MIVERRSLLVLEVLVLTTLYVAPIVLSFQDIGDYIFSYPFNKRDGSIYLSLLVGGTFNAMLFFGNVFFLIPRYLSKRKFTPYFIYLFLALGAITLSEIGIESWLESVYNLPNNLASLYPEAMTHKRDIGIPTVIVNIFILGLSFVYRFGRDWMRYETDKRHLVQEKLGAELKFLRSQINPHFLFNTLNNIYGIAQRNSDQETAGAIEKLSDLLRFMINDSNADLIPLEKEVTYLQSLIEIQQLRTGDGEVVVNFKREGDLSKILIPPMILIPFVENAFKYGVNVDETSLIVIELSAEGNELTFNVKNKKVKAYDSMEIEPSGIGISNVKSRLNLTYPDKHRIEIKDGRENFEVNLMLELT